MNLQGHHPALPESPRAGLSGRGAATKGPQRPAFRLHVEAPGTCPEPVGEGGMPFFFRHQKNAKNAQRCQLRWGTMNRTVRFVHPERVCGTRGASRMLFSQTLWLPACPACPERSRRERSRRLAHVCSHNELPTSSPQLRFLESGGPAVPGSRTNHRELHRSPGTGLPTSRTVCPGNSPPASSLQLPASRTSKSFAIHSYEKRACKPFAICSYAIVGLKVPWNEYLQKKGGGGGRLSRESGQRGVARGEACCF